jgi:dipeptidase E
VRLTTQGARFAVIANAIDAEPAEERRDKVAAEVQGLATLGLRATELDLREHVGESSDDLTRHLMSFDGVWVRGGNVFVLRNTMARSGADNAILDLLDRDAFVYAGYSAGPCVLGPSLAGLERVDDANATSRLGLGAAVMRGLGVLEQRVVPHVESSSHPESAALDRVAEQYARDGVPHLNLRDGEALVVDGDGAKAMRLVGRPATVAELMAAYGA